MATTAATSSSLRITGAPLRIPGRAVFSVREERIVALRDCRDRQEALQLAGLQT